jgi:GGDEF domain-containing protein
MGFSMRQQSALAATLVGLIGIGVGLAAGIAVVAWLGVVAGIAAVLAAYLVYLTANRMSRAEERTQELAAQVGQLESAVANQIQARMQAESEAKEANLRAADAELENALSDRSDSSQPVGELSDPLTGLFGEAYFLVSVEQRISAARRHLRPIAVALVEVVDDPTASSMSFSDPNVIAEALAETLRDADTACRLSDGRFALILEDTPENGAIWTIERLRRCLAARLDKSTLWAGLSCYPAHGFDTEEILSQAEVALGAARDWPQDRIEVAETR